MPVHEEQPTLRLQYPNQLDKELDKEIQQYQKNIAFFFFYIKCDETNPHWSLNRKSGLYHIFQKLNHKFLVDGICFVNIWQHEKSIQNFRPW